MFTASLLNLIQLNLNLKIYEKNQVSYTDDLNIINILEHFAMKMYY